MTEKEVNAMSALALAHVGDGVFELLVRTDLCVKGLCVNGNLHKQTVSRVCAPAQAEFANRILPLLEEKELAVYKRGRNAHVHAIPKNATASQYGKATGLEALFGWLHLQGMEQRVQELFEAGQKEEG
ncbi:MAG: ribonuclease III [Oscillospiraceae bacterium]|nr:ribonuclease III [Oscillospiraceae bacterium]